MIILRQHIFSSKSQKKMKEKWEVTKPLGYWKKVTEGFHKDAKELKDRADRCGSQEDWNNSVNLEARARVNDLVNSNIEKDPYIIQNDKGLEGFDRLTNEQKHLNKKMTREGVEDFQEWQRRGGVRGRAARVEKRKKETRGVKKVKGTIPEGQGQYKTKEERLRRLSSKAKEEFDRRKIARVEEQERLRAEQNAYEAEKLRKLGALKKAAIKKNVRKAAPWVIGGILATAGTVAGAKAIKKHKKDKKK